MNNLGTLEKDVMDIAWKQCPCGVGDVHEKLSKKRPLAYTTVMTIMSRLTGKGLLVRRKKKNAYVYSCACSKQHVVDSMVQSSIKTYMQHFGEETVKALAKSLSELPQKDRLALGKKLMNS